MLKEKKDLFKNNFNDNLAVAPMGLPDAEGQAGIQDEGMTPLWTTHARDGPGPLQGGEQLIQVRLRHLLPRGDLGALHRPLPIAVGQLNERPHAVIALGRYFHPAVTLSLAKLTAFLNNLSLARDLHRKPESPTALDLALSITCKLCSPVHRGSPPYSPLLWS